MNPPASNAPAARASHEHPPLVPAGEGCLEIVAERLRTTPGVVGFDADFRENTLTVRYQPSRIDTDQLDELAGEVAGLFAQRVTTCDRRQSLDACAECALRLGRVREFDATQYAVTADAQHVGISRRDVPVDSVELRRPIGTAKPWGATMTPAEQERQAKSIAMATLTGVSLLLIVVGMVFDRSPAPATFAGVAFAGAAICGGWFAFRSTMRALARMRFDVNALMILAAVGAAAIGYVYEAAVLMFLFSLSNTLEVYTMGRTRRALHALLKLRPAVARVVRDGREVEVEAESVAIGERVIVKPGETIPVDGRVAVGTTLVDQSSLTGESVPVEKGPGDTVYTGTLNQQGAIEVQATRAASDTTLSRIVTLVREAHEQKSRTEEIAEWVGRYYTVAVMVAAVAMVVIPPFVLGQPFRESFYRAMTLLVVASPCALVIATPATILSAIANAARHGVLFKGGRYVEALGAVKVVAFDKTGTLTRGRFEVSDVVAIAGANEDEILGWAAGAERRSPHPLAQAVVRAAERRGAPVVTAEQLTNHLGKGLVAQLEGVAIEIGTPDLFAKLGIAVPEAAVARLHALQQEGKTAMLVHRGAAWGVIAAMDDVRPAAEATVAALAKLGVLRVALLSGDSRPTVEAIAKRTGLHESHSALLPEDKVERIAKLEAEYGPVAMVGDGINDAPALARASVGIVMGGIGSDAAIESADVVLMSDDLTALPYALRLSRRARGIVIQNVSIAAGVMMVLVTWVFLGQHAPMGALKLPEAVSGHEGSTVIVILNGLRLLGHRREG